MKNLKVKKQYENTVIGFNNSGAPLGLRNDLHILYEMAVNTGQQNIIQMFEEEPTAEQIEEIKVTNFNSKQEEKRKLWESKNARKNNR